eukprot:g20888.t1
MEPPSPPPEVPLPPPPRPPPNTEEAVVRVQRWYRAQARRRRFMIIINRARRRRKYLEERRRVAQRVYSTEAAVEEMKARLAMPYGHRLVGRYSEARDAEAATRVQTLWRSVRAKKKLVKLIGEQQQQEAARRCITCCKCLSETHDSEEVDKQLNHPDAAIGKPLMGIELDV